MQVQTILAVLLMAIGLVSTQALAENVPPALTETPGLTTTQIVDRFVEHVRSSGAADETARELITSQWQQRRDGDDAESFLAESLAVVWPAFKQGLDLYDDGEYAKAAAAMAVLARHDDPYLSANAAVFEARSLVEQKRIEAAQQRLATLAAQEVTLRDHTLHAADVRFLIGYCQLHTLHYDEAIKTLETFGKDYPHASERLQVTAKQIVQELRRRQADGISDVADLMAYAGRRLGHGTSNKAVTSKQAKAVALLDALIKTAEDKECKSGSCKKCGGKSKGCKACGGPPSGNQQPSSPANQSKLPGGGSKTGQLRATVARPGEAWGQMPESERDRILQAVKKNFPARYRELVEQYYKQLARKQ